MHAIPDGLRITILTSLPRMTGYRSTAAWIATSQGDGAIRLTEDTDEPTRTAVHLAPETATAVRELIAVGRAIDEAQAEQARAARGAAPKLAGHQGQTPGHACDDPCSAQRPRSGHPGASQGHVATAPTDSNRQEAQPMSDSLGYHILNRTLRLLGVIRCRSCGALIDRGMTFCEACGADRPGTPALQSANNPRLNPKATVQRYTLCSSCGEIRLAPPAPIENEPGRDTLLSPSRST